MKTITKDGLIAYYHYQEGLEGNEWKNIAPDTEDDERYNLTLEAVELTDEGVKFKKSIPDLPTSTAYSQTMEFEDGKYTYELLIKLNNMEPDGINIVQTRLLTYGIGILYMDYVAYGIPAKGLIYGTDDNYMPVTYPVPYGDTIHITYTVDAITVYEDYYVTELEVRNKLYINGELVAEEDEPLYLELENYITNNHREQSIIMGDGQKAIGSGNDPFDGTVKLARIYDRKLSPEEIKNNYLQGEAVALVEPREPLPPKTIHLQGSIENKEDKAGSTAYNVYSRGIINVKVEGKGVLK